MAAALAIQAAYRGYRGRQVALAVKKEAMAIVLQAAWRMHVCRANYVAQRKAAVTFQGQWRVKMAKRELYRLRAVGLPLLGVPVCNTLAQPPEF